MWRRAVRTWWPEVRTRRREIPTWRREFSMWRREIRAWQRAQEELQAITARAQEMEEEAAWMRELQLEIESSLAGNLEASLLLKEIYDKMEIDQRSIYVGNVDYGATAEELEAFFHCCGKMNRVTILRDRFSGHPKGYAYIEFEEQSSMKAAMVLNKSLFRGRVIKVLPKRTNVPGISSTNRGGYHGHFRACRGLAQWGPYYGKQYTGVRGRAYRDWTKMLPCYMLGSVGLLW